jgi:Domain of unknown function (DUF1905)
VSRDYAITGQVELFPQVGGWHFVRVPRPISDELEHLADRGLIAIRATVGDVTWDTSMLPMGDGTKFIALKAEVRQANRLDLGDSVTVAFSPRER